MKSWSLVVLIFAMASVFCISGCQQADTKADPAFKKTKAPAQKIDRSNRKPEAPAV